MSLCYKDRAYCNAGVLCKSLDCTRRLSPEDAEAARSHPFPICYIDFTQAKCFVPFFCMEKPGKSAKRTPTGKKRTDFDALVRQVIGIKKQGKKQSIVSKRKGTQGGA